jgi:hypothetical protein
LTFDFQGARLSVLTQSRRWADKLRKGYDWYLAPEDATAQFMLRIEEVDDPRVPFGIPRTWTGPLLEGGQAHIYEAADNWTIEAVGRGYVSVNWQERTALAAVRPGMEDLFSCTPMTAVIDAAINAGGQQVLHAACLRRRGKCGGIVICAPSGSGKTTTTLALARQGFGFLADDTSVINQSDGCWKVWGIPNRLKIHRHTLTLLPWLGPLPNDWNSDGEQAIEFETIDHIIPISKSAPVPLDAIFMLGVRSRGRHLVKPLSRAAALTRIADDNISNSPAGINLRNRSQFANYACIVRDTPVFELNVGRELESLAEAIAYALEGALTDATRQ